MNDKSQKPESLWLGFVENIGIVQAVIDQDVTGYLVLLPSDAVNHVVKHHEFDGEGQRPATPSDYEQLWRVLAKGDITRGDDSALGAPRVVAKLKINGELFRAVFEARGGNKNLALVLVSLVIQTKNR